VAARLAAAGRRLRQGMYSRGVISDPHSGEPVDGLLACESDGGALYAYRTGDEVAANAWRERIGEEAFAAFRRRRELSRNPRPLTDGDRAILRRALAPVLADLAATGLSPDIREEARFEVETPAVCAWIQGPGGIGEGISVLLDFSLAAQVLQGRRAVAELGRRLTA
jgi:hypothetical protein